MNEDEIARGVSRGLHEYERRRAEGNAKSCLGGLGCLAVILVAFILLMLH